MNIKLLILFDLVNDLSERIGNETKQNKKSELKFNWFMIIELMETEMLWCARKPFCYLCKTKYWNQKNWLMHVQFQKRKLVVQCNKWFIFYPFVYQFDWILFFFLVRFFLVSGYLLWTKRTKSYTIDILRKIRMIRIIIFIFHFCKDGKIKKKINRNPNETLMKNKTKRKMYIKTCARWGNNRL